MNAHTQIDTRMSERQEYSPEFLEALAEEAKRCEAHWNASAKQVRKAAIAASMLHRAHICASLRWSACHALEGCPASIAELNDYFETDHLNLFRDVSLAASKVGEVV